MPIDLVMRVHKWPAEHRRLVGIVTWTCFAVVCADYARFIHLPTILVVPFWVGVVLGMLRWTVWEGLVRPKVQARIVEEESQRQPEAQTLRR